MRPLVLAFLLVALPVRADDVYRVERVETDGAVVRAYAVASLAPVEAVVRERASEAVQRAAPSLLESRDLGTHRLHDLRVEVRDVRFAPGRSPSEVRIEVAAEITAERDDRSITFRDFIPTFVYRPRGRVHVATGTLVVGVAVAIADGRAVVLRILGEKLEVAEPLELDLDLEHRLLHTHSQPIPAHPALDGLVPEAASLVGIADDQIHFVVRFRRV